MACVPVNYVAVGVSAVAAHFLGALWYSPALFGKAWMDATGLTKQKMEEMKKKGMAKAYFLSFVGSLLMSFVLACVIGHGGAKTPAIGAAVGFWTWLGFIAPVVLGSVLWEGKSFKVYAINVSFYLVSLVMMGAILAAWPAQGQTQTESIAFAVPILPGKTEEWKKFAQEITGPRSKEFAASRNRIGLSNEHSYLQQSPKGDMVVVTVEGKNAKNFCHMLGSSQDPFDIWFRQQVLEIHGMDLAKELPPAPEKGIDWKAGGCR